MTFTALLMLLACVCFLLAVGGWVRRINVLALGLLLWALALTLPMLHLVG